MVDIGSEFTRTDQKLAYVLGQRVALGIASCLPISEIVEKGTITTVLNAADETYAKLTGEDPLGHLGTVHRSGALDAIEELFNAHEGITT